MFERYTENALRVIFFARAEASTFGAKEVDAEHLLPLQDQLLLGRLAGTPIDVEAIRRKIRDRSGDGEPLPTSVDMPLSLAAKRVLAHFFDEENWLSHKHIDAEHLLLALLLEETTYAAEILRGLGLSAQKVRDDLAKRPRHG